MLANLAYLACMHTFHKLAIVPGHPHRPWPLSISGLEPFAKILLAALWTQFSDAACLSWLPPQQPGNSVPKAKIPEMLQISDVDQLIDVSKRVRTSGYPEKAEATPGSSCLSPGLPWYITQDFSSETNRWDLRETVRIMGFWVAGEVKTKSASNIQDSPHLLLLVIKTIVKLARKGSWVQLSGIWVKQIVIGQMLHEYLNEWLNAQLTVSAFRMDVQSSLLLTALSVPRTLPGEKPLWGWELSEAGMRWWELGPQEQQTEGMFKRNCEKTSLEV